MHTLKRTTAILLVILLAAALFTFAAARTSRAAGKHPVEVTGLPACSECHNDGRASLDHNQGFISRHKFYASQQRDTCQACHAESFCSDCHAHKEELKPSDKFKDSPERTLPHRGDYLNQHKIDGKINPAACFPCHGRQNNERCIVCHK